MEYLFFYGFSGVFSWGLWIAIVILFIRVSRLNHLVKDLNKRISELMSGEVLSKENQNVYQNNETVKEIEKKQIISSETQNIIKEVKISDNPQLHDPISDWFKENLLLKIGILMILVGFGWFVSYAFIHNWIGPVGRITLGVVIGSLVTIFGTMRLGKNEIQGNGLTILGTALVIMTLLAGQNIYGFFSPTIMLAMIFMVSLYTSVSAVGYLSEKLAIYGLLISLFAPFLSNTSSMEPVTLYLYLGVISIATIWVSSFTGWRILSSIGITGILIYSISFSGFLSRLPSKYSILMIVYGISMIYLVVGIWDLIKNKIKAESSDLYLTVVNTIIVLFFTTSIVPTIYQSLTLAAWMLIYAFSGFFVFEKTENEKLFYIHSLVSILLLVLATSIELSGPTLVIAFAIEAAIISVASFVVTNKIKVAEIMGLLLFLPFVMSMSSIASSSWKNGIFHSDLVVLLVMTIILSLLGMFYRMNNNNNVGLNKDIQYYHVAFILSTFYVYVIIWLSSHSIIKDDDSAVFLSLFIYTIIGLITHFLGLFRQNSMMKKYGMTILILVVIRLVLVDVWNMELSLRVITFIVLGVMFMSSAFISKNQKATSNLIQN